MPLTCYSLFLSSREVWGHILESLSFWLLMSTFDPCDDQSSTQNFPKTEPDNKTLFDFPPTIFLLRLALVLHHHFRPTRRFGTDSNIVSQHHIPTLKVYLGKIVEFRQALIERVVEQLSVPVDSILCSFQFYPIRLYAFVIIMRSVPYGTRLSHKSTYRSLSSVWLLKNSDFAKFVFLNNN